MDVLYEESAVSKNAAKAEKKYKVINVFSWISLILGLIFVMILLPNLIASFSKAQPTEDISAEDIAKAIASAGGMAFMRECRSYFSGCFGFFSIRLKNG